MTAQPARRRWLALAVDDDPACLRLLRETLLAIGCRVVAVSSGAQALSVLEEREPDLVVLDVGLPDVDGFEVCRRIRTFSLVPVIMLTALDGEADTIAGLDSGADDYVTKPFSPGELAARVRAVLRRADQQAANPRPATLRVQASDLLIDDEAKRVLRGQEEIDLSPTERRLLWELATGSGRVIPHRVLIERVWGPSEYGAEETLRSTIRRLRRRLGDDPDRPRYIRTKPGLGYVFLDGSESG